ncbi:hypothetical protein VHEMI02648 [[Torrubiella] hemipterigena]|uniref:Uncharacterized protein n=1 Tax=[Torrubiella] hemipterigena TaxID=1531966 RepID=A0A0A1SQ76_9HYPO|nr:hypothetical protein VHEMI02648 [[Torrubiella] hemipterigena]
MPSATKPKLEKLATPLTSNFPSEITSAKTATPVSALPVPIKADPDWIKTPISPPPAYADFLSKIGTLNSPAAIAPGDRSPESAPTSAVSDKSDASAKSSPETSPPSSRGSSKASPPTSAFLAPPSPYSAQLPMSAPPTGASCFPSLKLPPSPALSTFESPLSAASTLRSPFSARSVRSSVFDWDAALKARFAEQKKQKAANGRSVRHIREVVTRTVTYTPTMEPAPRGKRRKVE